MRKVKWVLGSAALALTLAACGADADRAADDAADAADASGTDAAGDAEGTAAATTAVDATSIDYGNDASEYANDGECDDMRFEGDAMAAGLVAENIGRDATDCRAAAEAGEIAVNALFNQPDNYGDDTSEYANDDECDDVRYAIDYADRMFYIPEDIGHDATDCRADVEAGRARWQGPTANPVRGMTRAELEAMAR